MIGWLLLLDELIIQDADGLGRVTGHQSQLPIWMLRWRFIPFFCLNAWSSADISLLGLYYLECSCCCHRGTRLIPRYVGNQGLNGKSVGFLSRFLSLLCLFPSCPYFVYWYRFSWLSHLPPGRLVSPGVPDLSLESWLSRYSKLIHGCRFLFLEAYQGQYQAKKTVKGLLWSIPGSSPGSIIQNYLINK